MVFELEMQQTRRMEWTVFVSADFLFLVSVFSNVRDVLQILVVRLSLSHWNHMRLIRSFWITMDPFFSLGSIYAASLTQSSVSHWLTAWAGEWIEPIKSLKWWLALQLYASFRRSLLKRNWFVPNSTKKSLIFIDLTVYAILKNYFLDRKIRGCRGSDRAYAHYIYRDPDVPGPCYRLSGPNGRSSFLPAIRNFVFRRFDGH